MDLIAIALDGIKERLGDRLLHANHSILIIDAPNTLLRLWIEENGFVAIAIPQLCSWRDRYIQLPLNISDPDFFKKVIHQIRNIKLWAKND